MSTGDLGLSDMYLKLLRGEITSREYVDAVEAEVGADIAKRRANSPCVAAHRGEEIDADRGMKGTRRAYGKKHERKRIGREGRKSVRSLIRALLP